MTAVDRRKIERPLGSKDVRTRHQQAADRREGLGVAEHFLTLDLVGEKLGQPRHRSHELDADTDEDKAAEEQELVKVLRKSRRTSREGVKQDAVSQYPPPAEPVGQVSTQQAEDTAGDRRHEKQNARPLVEGRAPGKEKRHAVRIDSAERRQCRLDDQRQHQQLVNIKGEAERGDGANEPLGRGELGNGHGDEV